MPQIQKISIFSSPSQPISKQQRNFHPNKQQILRNLEQNTKETIIINPHSNNINNLDNIDTDKNNRCNDLMISKYTDK